ncbi:PREDICTED: C-type lectin domain family 4 member A-like [Condylura cristata]|uniref:C-type lectin domain family 4 member A-like n=1 Tax=Condylura cristata TaxID=143302 RepID=UPI000642F22E|nr:PREDICTED: C-type lectin domain family 4 member A-like [Condylura cristata]
MQTRVREAERSCVEMCRREAELRLQQGSIMMVAAALGQLREGFVELGFVGAGHMAEAMEYGPVQIVVWEVLLEKGRPKETGILPKCGLKRKLSNVTFKEMTGVTGVTKVMGVTGREGNFSCCPTGWKPFGSSCYFISNAPKTQPESEENCLVMEAHLLVITSEEEQNFIIQNLDTAFLYCIGLTETLKPSDPSGKRHWQWVDQTPYNESATFWHKNEPGHNNKHCVVLHSHTITNKWGWVSVECLLPYRSICEMTKISCSVEQSP